MTYFLRDFRFSRLVSSFKVSWDVAPCSHVEVGRRFIVAYCLHHQGDEWGSTHLWIVSTSTWLHGATSQTTLNFILAAENLKSRKECHFNPGSVEDKFNFTGRTNLTYFLIGKFHSYWEYVYRGQINKKITCSKRKLYNAKCETEK
jgi:hypothetical protein